MPTIKSALFSKDDEAAAEALQELAEYCVEDIPFRYDPASAVFAEALQEVESRNLDIIHSFKYLHARGRSNGMYAIEPAKLMNTDRNVTELKDLYIHAGKCAEDFDILAEAVGKIPALRQQFTDEDTHLPTLLMHRIFLAGPPPAKIIEKLALAYELKPETLKTNVEKFLRHADSVQSLCAAAMQTTARLSVAEKGRVNNYLSINTVDAIAGQRLPIDDFSLACAEAPLIYRDIRENHPLIDPDKIRQRIRERITKLYPTETVQNRHTLMTSLGEAFTSIERLVSVQTSSPPGH